MRKGKMEMVGLTVIVVILILAFILFLTLNRGQDNSSITSKESLYANNLLNAIMFYSIYGKESISDSLVKCDSYSKSIGRDESNIRKYCSDVEGKITNEIMPKILRKNQNYGIDLSEGCGEINNIQESYCTGDYITASPYYIKTTGTCEVRLRIC